MSNKKGLQVFNKIFSSPAKETSQLIIDKIKEGEVDPAYVMVALKKLSKVTEQILTKPIDKEAKELMQEAVKKFQEGTKKSFEVFGQTVTIADNGYLDYSETQDEYLEALMNIEKKVKELISFRKEYHKTKVQEWHAMSSPDKIQSFGVHPYNVSWDNIPKLIFEEEYAEVETNPPFKRSKETLRFKV